MKFDLHTHHKRCGHAIGEISEYIQAAIDAGMHAIGISDHSPYFGSPHNHAQPGITMAKSEFPRYIAEVLRLKTLYKEQIEVLLGVESDFFPEFSSLYAVEYSKYPFDYVIGSVHFTQGISIFNRRRWDKLTAAQMVYEKESYYDLIRQSAQCGMFQILGHIDAMKGYYPEFSAIPAPAAIDEALRIIGECGLAIEINTSGKTKDCGGWYPSDDILERALYHHVDVTFGSDAHKPSRVGDDFEQVRTRLQAIGFKEWVYFRRKQREAVLL